MKRRNVQLAFVGEDSAPEESVTASQRGDEAVTIDVQGGHLMIVVPAGTPDAAIFDAATSLGGELTLEDGRRFSFEIKGDEAVGAQFGVTDPAVVEQDHQGLSTLPDVPGGV